MITNALGEKERFDQSKVERTCIRAGASREAAQKISRYVASQITDGMRTKEILRITLEALERMAPTPIASRYDLKGAIMRLGPAGFAFETFFSELLNDSGYTTQTRQILQGACIPHEIDIIAEKDGKKWLVECKYRNYTGEYIRVKDALYTYARFLDLKEGYEQDKCPVKFDNVWLATNTKFSDDVEQYTKCKGIKLTAWKYPPGLGIAEIVERKKLYPITVLRSLDPHTQKMFAQAGLMLCRDLVKLEEHQLKDIAAISYNKAIIIREEAREICSQ